MQPVLPAATRSFRQVVSGTKGGLVRLKYPQQSNWEMLVYTFSAQYPKWK
jgi:hypothetical protein